MSRAGSDGRVFFQNLRVLATGAYGRIDQTTVGPKLTIPQNGIAAVDIPGFWLGHTDVPKPTGNSSPAHTSAQIAGEIVVPEGYPDPPVRRRRHDLYAPRRDAAEHDFAEQRIPHQSRDADQHRHQHHPQ